MAYVEIKTCFNRWFNVDCSTSFVLPSFQIDVFAGFHAHVESILMFNIKLAPLSVQRKMSCKEEE